MYCANSCYVKISTIIEKMDDKRFIDIPKVLILQTCQGASLQYGEFFLNRENLESNHI